MKNLMIKPTYIIDTKKRLYITIALLLLINFLLRLAPDEIPNFIIYIMYIVVNVSVLRFIYNYVKEIYMWYEMRDNFIKLYDKLKDLGFVYSNNQFVNDKYDIIVKCNDTFQYTLIHNDNIMITSSNYHIDAWLTKVFEEVALKNLNKN